MKHSYRTVDPKDLIPATENPQTMKPAIFSALKAAVEEDGGLLDDPVVWNDGGKLRIVSGHHRVKALSEKGLPCHVKVIEDERADERWYRRRVLSANKVRGETDEEAMQRYLAGAFADLELDQEGQRHFFDDLGFNMVAISAYLREAVESSGDGAKELDAANFQNFQHRCPRCDFGFD